MNMDEFGELYFLNLPNQYGFYPIWQVIKLEMMRKNTHKEKRVYHHAHRFWCEKK
jgi:hypothetical protein